jgi:hypothetical protein
MLVKHNSVLKWIALFFCLTACFFCFRMTAFAEEIQPVDDPAVVLNQETDNTAQQSVQTEAVAETEQNVPAAENTTIESSDAETSETAAANDSTEESGTVETTDTETVEKGDHVYDTENSFGFNHLGYENKDAVSQQTLLDFLLYYSIYKNGDMGVIAKSKNILAYTPAEGTNPNDYNIFLTPYSVMRLYLQDEILKWGQQHGKDWTKNTLIKNFTFDLKTATYFYNENGEPVNFLLYNSESILFNYWINNIEKPKDIKSDITADHVIFTVRNNYWPFNDESDERICPFSNLPRLDMIQGAGLMHFDPNYRGILNVEYKQEVLCIFEVDGQKYEILIHNPEDVAKFVVDDGITKNNKSESSDADMNAEIKTTDHNGNTTVRSNSENKTITGVVRGNQITYMINIDLSTETEMLLKLYQGIALQNHFSFDYSDAAKQFVDDHGLSLSRFCPSWIEDSDYKPFYPIIEFIFTLPKDKDANGNYDLIVDEDALKNVQLIQKDGTPLWRLDPCMTKYDPKSRELKFYAYLSPDQIAQSFAEKINTRDMVPQFDHEKALALLNSMIGDHLTAVISGVRVSDLAEIGKPFTVKAKVSGSLDYKNSYVMEISDHGVPGAKPNPGGDFEDADAGWDEDVSYQSARRAVRMLRAVAAASAEGTYTEDDLYSPLNVSDYDLHQLLFGHFAWTHLQDPSTKDVIQSEDNSEEFWYTVIIPSLDITKEVKGTNTDQEFNFELKLDDAAMAGPFNGTTYNAELHENGTVQNIAVNFNNGTATFKLKNGQTIRIIVPFDTHFTLRETDHNGYFVTIDKNGNRIFSDTLSGIIESYTSLEDIEANKNAYTFTNEYEEPEQPEEPKEANVEETRSTGVQTGVMTQTGMWMVLALASIVILHKQRA